MTSKIDISESFFPSRSFSGSSESSSVIARLETESNGVRLANINRDPDDICQLCNDILTVPRILNCFHVLDQHCLDQHMQMNQQFESIECPACGHKTPLQPFGSPGIASLPLSLPTLVRLAVKAQSPDPVVSVTHRLMCTLCTPLKHAQGSYFCIDCPAFLCHTAHLMHRDLRIFTSHRVIRMLELSRAEFPNDLLAANCPLHNRPLTSFCFDCNVSVFFLLYP